MSEGGYQTLENIDSASTTPTQNEQNTQDVESVNSDASSRRTENRASKAFFYQSNLNKSYSSNKKRASPVDTSPRQEETPFVGSHIYQFEEEEFNDEEIDDILGQEDSPVSKKKRFYCLNTVKVSVIFMVFVLFIGGMVLLIEVLNLLRSHKKSTSLNVHVKLSRDCEESAIGYNNLIRKEDKNSQIDLKHVQLPHITLYLTYFTDSNIQELKDIIDVESKKWKTEIGSCSVSQTNNIDANGEYVMWDTENNACLQYMSDSIVNSTHALIDKSSALTIPTWIGNLPPEQKKIKIQMIKDYGSPNVYSEFQPHITLSHDDITPDFQKSIAEKLAVSRCTFNVRSIAIGKTGNYGTVLRNQDLKEFRVF